MILTAMLTFSGVLVSPAARSTVPKMISIVRNRLAVYSVKKYRDAILRMAASACIQMGICPLRDSVAAMTSTPTTSATSTACPDARRAFSCSPAPQTREINARKPTLNPCKEMPTSQFTVEVAPTAAVACVPSEPTMAVSIYCTAVWSSCSSMVGHASVMITEIIALFSFSGTRFSMYLPRSFPMRS